MWSQKSRNFLFGIFWEKTNNYRDLKNRIWDKRKSHAKATSATRKIPAYSAASLPKSANGVNATPRMLTTLVRDGLILIK